MINRRSLITGLISFAVTAPAIVRAASLMLVKSYPIIGWDLGSESYTAIIEYWDGKPTHWFLSDSGLYVQGFRNNKLVTEKVDSIKGYL
jgi:hypothetical protein